MANADGEVTGTEVLTFRICTAGGRYVLALVDAAAVLGRCALPLRRAIPNSGELTPLLGVGVCSGSTIGMTWDHALSDVGGVALLLAHVSAAYAAAEGGAPPGDAAVLPRLDGDRSLQAGLVSSQSSAAMGAAGANAGTAVAAEPEPETELVAARRAGGGGGGGVAVLDWAYTAAELAELKAAANAETRHQAVFADTIGLLRRASPAAVRNTLLFCCASAAFHWLRQCLCLAVVRSGGPAGAERLVQPGRAGRWSAASRALRQRRADHRGAAAP